MLSESTKRRLTFVLVAIAGVLLVVAGAQDDAPSTQLGGFVLALVATVMLAFDLSV